MTFLSRKEAQEYIDGLAVKWKVPPIKVIKLAKNLRPPGIGVYFADAPEWHIGITNRATKEKIKHEFGHYLVALVGMKLKVEEEIINHWT